MVSVMSKVTFEREGLATPELCEYVIWFARKNNFDRLHIIWNGAKQGRKNILGEANDNNTSKFLVRMNMANIMYNRPLVDAWEQIWITLCHELRHVKQFKSGMFKCNASENYHSDPMEVDARAWAKKEVGRLLDIHPDLWQPKINSGGIWSGIARGIKKQLPQNVKGLPFNHESANFFRSLKLGTVMTPAYFKFQSMNRNDKRKAYKELDEIEVPVYIDSAGNKHRFLTLKHSKMVDCALDKMRCGYDD